MSAPLVDTVGAGSPGPPEGQPVGGGASAGDGDGGLDPAEAAARLAADGPNDLPARASPTLARLLVGQLANTITVVLVGAAIVTGLTGEATGTVVIVVILVANAVIGVVQQRRAQAALDALAARAAPEARVWRGGTTRVVPASAVVVGDHLLIQAGDVVAADAVLVAAAGLAVDQSALTGESAPVDKAVVAGSGPPALAPTDRPDLVLSGTSVTHGRGRGVVVATGARTELGQVAALLDAALPPTPLQRRLDVLGRRIALATCGLCGIVFAVGLARGVAAAQMFVAAASLAVAAIPESLPAVVTVSLALGAERMARRHALVRRLLAVETLGSVNVICCDKTGTLTAGTMVAERLWTCDGEWEASGSGYDVAGALHPLGAGPRAGAAGAGPPTGLAGRAAALCNDAHLVARADGSGADAVGEPTEAALLALAAKAGAVEPESPGPERLGELAFDSTRRRMTTVHRAPDGQLWVSMKGAPEAVLPLVDEVDVGGRLRPASAADRAAIGEQADRYAAAGYRVLALAGAVRPDRADGTDPLDGAEARLAFYGLVGLADPPRPEAAGALAEARRAGIAPVMITGDHPATAAAVAERLGLLDGRRVLTGAEVAALGPDGLRAVVGDVGVFARTSAAQKLDIVTALQAGGATVAMTGDGVNDAPALHHADIGVALGRTGTEVAKGASDLVLADDDVATIVAAVGEGRRIYDNIRRFVRYGLTGGTAEIWVMLVGPFLGMPLPLLPVQILWVNLLTHGLPGLALAVEPADDDVMARPPRDRRDQLLDGATARHIAIFGVLTAATALAVAGWARSSGRPWQTMLFTTLATLQLGNAVAARSDDRPAWRLGWRSNRLLGLTVAGSIAAQLLVVSWRPVGEVLHARPLSSVELLVVAVASCTTFAGIELDKWRRRRARRLRPGRRR